MARVREELEFDEWENLKGYNNVDLGLFGDFEAVSLRIYSDDTLRLYGFWYPCEDTVEQWGLPRETKCVEAELIFDADINTEDIELASDAVFAHWYSWDIQAPEGEEWEQFSPEIAAKAQVWLD